MPVVSMNDPHHFVHKARAYCLQPITQPSTNTTQSHLITHRIFVNQFDNENNWKAHYTSTGPELYHQLSMNNNDNNERHVILISAVGTGGTLSGTAAFLKQATNHHHNNNNNTANNNSSAQKSTQCCGVSVYIVDAPGSGIGELIKAGTFYSAKDRQLIQEIGPRNPLLEGISLNFTPNNLQSLLPFLDGVIHLYPSLSQSSTSATTKSSSTAAPASSPTTSSSSLAGTTGGTAMVEGSIIDVDIVGMIYYILESSGLLIGGSSAANLLAILRLAANHHHHSNLNDKGHSGDIYEMKGSDSYSGEAAVVSSIDIVTFFSDSGFRYTNTLFNPTWLKSRNLFSQIPNFANNNNNSNNNDGNEKSNNNDSNCGDEYQKLSPASKQLLNFFHLTDEPHNNNNNS